MLSAQQDCGFTPALAMAEFYKIDGRKISFAEYWHLSPNWQVLIPWIMKLLGMPLKIPTGVPHPSALDEYQVTEDQLAPEVLKAMSVARGEMEQAGFHSPAWIHMPDLQGNTATSGASFLHSSGKVVGRVMYTKAKAAMANLVIEKLSIFFITPLTDGRILVTTNMPPSFRGLPYVSVQRRPGAPARELYELHMQRVSALPTTTSFQKLETIEERDSFLRKYELESFEYHVRRGLYVPITDAEVTQTKVEKESIAAAEAQGQRYPRVLAEIDRIQNKKASWTSTLVLLAVSAAIFVALGAFRWSWETVAIILGVLFFHEMGHYVAMRAFNYQNLRMFFIPLLGAAVSGRNYNVKGWQKVIVSLAGPLPGILVGALLGIFAIATGESWAIKIALMALLLNGINLLPILPLDGGWVMHTIVFCRRLWLEGVFYVLAGAIMIAYRLAGGEKFWLYFGIFMLLTAPATFRIARVAHRLRARGVSAISADQQTIPRETAETIIDEITSSVPGPHTDKTLASLALSVFEKLNSTPPSLGASILLSLAYVGSLLFAVLFAGVLMIARSGL